MANEARVGKAVAEGAGDIADRIAMYLENKGAKIAPAQVEAFTEEVAQRLKAAGRSTEELLGTTDDDLASKVQGLFKEPTAGPQARAELPTPAAAEPPASLATQGPRAAAPTQAPSVPSAEGALGGAAGRGASGSWGKKAAVAGAAGTAVAGGLALKDEEPAAVAAANPGEAAPAETPLKVLPPGLSADGKVAPAFISSIGKLDLAGVGKQPTQEEYGLAQNPAYRPETEADTELKHALDEHRAVLNSLASEYRTAQSATDRQQLWEGIVQGIGLMVSGLYGLHAGVDMSGVKFAPSDWEAKRRLELAQFQEFRQGANEQFGANEKYAQGLRQTTKEGNAQLERDWNNNAKRFEGAARAYNERVDQANKAIEHKFRDATLHNDMAYKSAELELQGAKLTDALQRTTNAAQKAHLQDQAKALDKESKLVNTFNATMARGVNSKNSDERKAAAFQLQQQAADYKQLTGKTLPGMENVPYVDTKGGFFSSPGARDVRDIAADRGKAMATPGAYPKHLTNGSQQATVQNAAEEAEANKAGFK